MAKSLALDEVNTSLLAESPDVVKLEFKVTFPKNNQLHVVVSPKLRGDNVATLTKPKDDNTAETTLKFVSSTTTFPQTEVSWNITVKANFDTKVLSASGKGDSKTDYSFSENIATW